MKLQLLQMKMESLCALSLLLLKVKMTDLKYISPGPLVSPPKVQKHADWGVGLIGHFKLPVDVNVMATCPGCPQLPPRTPR